MSMYFINGQIENISEIDHLRPFLDNELFEAVQDFINSELENQWDEHFKEIEHLQYELENREEKLRESQSELKALKRKVKRLYDGL